MSDANPDPGQTLSFGPFTLQTIPKQLVEGIHPIRLGGRALELLVLLVTRAGQVVGKSEIMATIWPAGAVGEINLRVHIAALRRALGDGEGGVRYIANVAGRGYAFVAPVFEVNLTQGRQADGSPHSAPRRHNLPAGLTRLVGRDSHRTRLLALVQQRRFVSIVGPGGVGKTSLALDVGNRMVSEFVDGVWLVELANISEASRILPAIAQGIDFVMPQEASQEALLNHLGNKSLLLILDNCEHIAELLAPLAMRILLAAPDLRLLLTSREPMQADGEWVQRLPALGLPSDEDGATLQEVAHSPAVQLFVERAISFQDGFELTSANFQTVSDICRRLDGLPFAIELAAARVDTFGVAGTLKLLESHSSLLAADGHGRASRHRAMESLLDWSYELLTPDEQTLLRRLSVFRGDFPIEWACEMGMLDRDRESVIQGIFSLVTKSLLMTRTKGEEVQYGTLQTTRDYSYAKFSQSAEVREVRRRHAQLLCDYFRTLEPNWDTRSRSDWITRHGRTIEEIRFALDWALGDDGDVTLGIELTMATVSLSCHLSLLGEANERLSQAIAVLPRLNDRQPRLAMRLHLTRAVLRTQTEGPSARLSADFDEALRTCEADEGTEDYAELANAMWLGAIAFANFRDALGWAESVGRYAQRVNEPFFHGVFNRLACSAHHYLGQHSQALACADQVLHFEPTKFRLGVNSPMPLDRRVSIRIIQSRILWMTGLYDQALEVAQEALGYSRSDVTHSFALASSLAMLPICIWSGIERLAAPVAKELFEHTSRNNIEYWHTWSVAYDVLLREGHGRDDRRDFVSAALQCDFSRDHFCTFDPDLLFSRTLARIDEGQVGWVAPEAFRAAGAKLLQVPTALAQEQAKELFNKSLSLAREQKALAWELRTSTSLARMLQSEGDEAAARALLEPILERVVEGLHTRDVQAAIQLMEEVG